MRRPNKSFRIWMTQRSGSTLLCEILTATQVLGKPGEHFNVMDDATLCARHKVSSYLALKEKLWALGTSANGVFGLKDAMYTAHYRKIVEEISQLRGLEKSPTLDHEVFWSDLFPNCKHIYLSRRNKVRQAVSWWKAINDQIWHLRPEEQHQNKAHFYTEKYDFAALSHLLKEIALKECATETYFSKYGIRPLNLVYEDFIQDFQGTIRNVANYLEIELLEIPEMTEPFKRTANPASEEWVQRFRKELQGEHEIW